MNKGRPKNLFSKAQHQMDLMIGCFGVDIIAVNNHLSLVILKSKLQTAIIVQAIRNVTLISQKQIRTNLCEFVVSFTNKAVEDKRLRVDIAILREMVQRKEVSVEWIEWKYQLADSLTKMGVDSSKLLDTMRYGKTVDLKFHETFCIYIYIYIYIYTRKQRINRVCEQI